MNRLYVLICATLTLLPFAGVAHASGATITVSNTSYATGGTFHVEGNVTDSGGVNHVTVSVPGGFGIATLSGSMFTADVHGTVNTAGTYTITIRSYDNAGAITVYTTTISVVGEYTVFYDRTVDTTAGAYANLELIDLPHLYDGKVVVSGTSSTYAVIVQQVYNDAPATCIAADPLTTSHECDFFVHNPTSATGRFAVAWAQAPLTSVSVTISGYVL